jgi:two-component SAPR family response regulator
VFTVSAQEIQYGLKFNSNNYEPEARTSLNLSPDGYLSFPEGFSMSFDAKFHFKDVHIYGYVFRIVDDEENSIDLVIGDANLSFSMPSGGIASNNTLSDVNIIPDRWVTIRINVDIEREELGIRIGDYYVGKWDVAGLRGFKNVEIVFGKINDPRKQVIDVPDMTVKNLEIADLSGKPQYSWKLSMHVLDGVYDDLKHRFAKCENPNWLLDNYGTWKKETTFTTGRTPYLSYDFDRNIVAVADQHAFYTFSVRDSRLEKQAINEELSYNLTANQMIYNPLDSNFYAYNLIKENDAREFVPFDLTESGWGHTTAHRNSTDYRHHNRYFSPQHDRLYLFGGYGHLKYKGGVFIYDVDSKIWSKTAFKGYIPAPRYLGGMGKMDDDHLLLFGGYGSETGDQSLQPQFYYDCYIADVRTMEAKKLWTLDHPVENFVVSNSLVVDTANNCFYALCYPSMKSNSLISLYKFSLEKPEYEIIADQMPIKFNDVLSYVDLFFDKAENKLITATFAPDTATEANVSVYTISFPPLKKSDIYQTEGRRSFPVFPLILLLLFSALVLILLFIGKKKKQAVPGAVENEIREDNDVAMAGINTVKQLQKQTINLFGGFQVVDKQENDITAEFTPLLKNLFLLILLNTIKTGKGVSFFKLKEIFWFDKSEESANNSRGVALSKIRQIMGNVSKIRFNKNGSCWNVEFEEDIYCDYYESLVLIKKIKENKGTTINDIKRLLAIVMVGELLPNVQFEWADAFKSDFSNELVDLILYLIRQDAAAFSDDIYIDMANALLVHDPLNEDALKLKCKVLVKMGKNGLAKNTFTTFIKEYAVLFGAEYKYSFEQIVN